MGREAEARAAGSPIAGYVRPIDALVKRHFDPMIGKVPGITVAVVKNSDVQVLGLGTMAARQRLGEDCWEIGSITKTFTGMLLAEMSSRGEVGLDDPIGVHLPFEIAERLPDTDRQPTLLDLATHHAGLPSVPLVWLIKVARSDDPYAQLTEAQVFDRLGPRTKLARRPKFRYSNLGVGLLGHILERVAHQPYSTLLRERLLDPLGLDHSNVGTCADGGHAVQGFRRGKPTPAWTFGALPACGAMRSTITDLVTVARNTIEPPSGRVGDVVRLATTPRRDGRGRDMRVGLGWMIRTIDSRDVIWHNGGTYGASSFLGVDRTRAVAVIALGNAGPRLIPRLDGPSWALLAEINAD